ncbi:MAG: anti-sigma factor antagonist [Clostridia bacterium]|nr:anti-sigma factor antagonist [Clostridia bacterium]
MGVSISCKNNVVTACIDGDIDHHTAKDIREKVDSYIVRTSPKLLILDFKEVQFMDTSGIGLIMGRFKYMKSVNGKMKVENIPKRLERMMKLSGIGKLGII